MGFGFFWIFLVFFVFLDFFFGNGFGKKKTLATILLEVGYRGLAARVFSFFFGILLVDMFCLG